MSLDTWVSTGILVGILIALFTYLSSITRGLRDDIGGLRTELKGDIAGLRTEVKGDIAGLDTKIDNVRTELKSDIAAVGSHVQKLDERIYDLATGRQAHPLIVPPMR